MSALITRPPSSPTVGLICSVSTTCTSAKKSMEYSRKSYPNKLISVSVRGTLLSFFPTIEVFRYKDKQKMSLVLYNVVQDDKQWWYIGLKISISPGLSATAITCSANVK
jgi:hypothetical protein